MSEEINEIMSDAGVYEDAPKKKSKVWLIILIVVAVLLLCCCCITVLVLIVGASTDWFYDLDYYYFSPLLQLI